MWYCSTFSSETLYKNWDLFTVNLNIVVAREPTIECKPSLLYVLTTADLLQRLVTYYGWAKMYSVLLTDSANFENDVLPCIFAFESLSKSAISNFYCGFQLFAFADVFAEG